MAFCINTRRDRSICVCCVAFGERSPERRAVDSLSGALAKLSADDTELGRRGRCTEAPSSVQNRKHTPYPIFFLVFKFRDHSKPHSHTPRRIPRQKFIAKLFAFRKIRKIPKPRRGPSEFFYLADCHRGIIVRFYFVYVYMLYIPLI